MQLRVLPRVLSLSTLRTSLHVFQPIQLLLILYKFYLQKQQFFAAVNISTFSAQMRSL